MSHYIVRVDLGQTTDPTAIAVLDVAERRAPDPRYDAQGNTLPDEYREQRLGESTGWRGGTASTRAQSKIASVDVVHPVRMAYPEQIQHVDAFLHRSPLVGARLVVDQTGVGRPVVDFFRRAGLHPIAITITGGHEEILESATLEEWHVPKSLLVSRLQSLLHAGELRIAPGLKDAKVLATELSDFRGKFNERGYAQFGAREGAHDDLVLSVALGCWIACKPVPTWGSTTFSV